MSGAPLHAVIYLDRPGAGDARAALRPAHLSYLADHLEGLKAAGPLLDAGGAPCGSLLVFQATDSAALEQLASGDPYVAGGVIETVRVLRWDLALWTLTGSPLEDAPSGH